MTLMDTRRNTNLDRRLAELWARCCEGKVHLGANAARQIAAFSRTPAQNPEIGPIEAYRCPFADEHPDPDLAWHVGRAMSTWRLVETARLLRARSGNAPAPVNRSRAAQIGRAVPHRPKRRKGRR